MRYFLMALLVFSTSGVARGAEPNATEKALLEHCSEKYVERARAAWGEVQKCAERVELIRHAEVRVTIGKPVKKDGRAFFPRASMKAKYLAKAEQLLAEAKKDFIKTRDHLALYMFLPPMPWTPKTGSLGTIESVRVLQIVGEDQMLGERRLTDDLKALADLIRKDPMLGEYHIEDFKDIKQTFWIKGVDTSNMADDRDVSLRAMFVCTGNKTYETVSGGTNTIMVLEPFDITNVKKLWKPPRVKLPSLSGETEEEAEAAPAEPKYRKWTSADGKSMVEAEFAYIIGDTVVLLRKDNGKKIKVAKNQLSQTDLKWLESHADQ